VPDGEIIAALEAEPREWPEQPFEDELERRPAQAAA